MTSIRFVRHHGEVLRGMGAVIFEGLRAREGSRPDVPGPEIQVRIPPRPDDLVDAYVTHVGGDVRRHARTVPPHLFPQWAFSLTGRLLAGQPYPLLRAVNGGCRLEVRGELPRGRDLLVRGQLVRVDDDGRKAVLYERFATGTEEEPDLVTAEVRVFVPLAKGPRQNNDRRAEARVAEGAREVGRFEAGPRAGLHFAMLTGDFNPVHWSRSYARMSGFESTILHGFGTFSRAWEILSEVGPIATLDARFTRPLVLPNRATVWTADRNVWVTDAAGTIVMEGTLAP